MTNSEQRHAIEANALDWLARIPFLRADEVESFLGPGVDEADVRRALTTLERLGWIERIEARSPEIAPQSLYAVRDAAVPRLSAVLQLNEDALARCYPVGRRETLARLASLELTDHLNGFLRALEAVFFDEANLELVDLRALPRARRDERSWWPRGVDAYACLRSGERYAHLFVAWDRRGAPAAHRQRRVAGWHDAWEAADWWGRECLPRILVIAASARQELEWERAILASAERRSCPELDVRLTHVDATREDVAGEIWREAGDDRRRSPTARLRWGADPPPVPRPLALRHDLLRRGVAVARPSLAEWFPRVVASGRGAVRERLAALSLALDAEHKSLLQQIGRHPYLGLPELRQLSGSPQEVSRTLIELRRWELVATIERPQADRRRRPRTHCFLTHLGLRLLAARDDVPPLRYLQHSVIAAEASPAGKGGERLWNLRRNLDHTLGVNACFARLAADAERAGHGLPYWWSEAEATVRFEGRDGGVYWIRPDGAGLYYLGERRIPFLLEYDHGTMRRRDYLRKLRGLCAYYGAAAYRGFFGDEPVLLVIAADDRAEQRFAAAVREAERRWRTTLPVLLTARWRIDGDRRDREGMLGGVWRTADSDQRRRWLGRPEVAEP